MAALAFIAKFVKNKIMKNYYTLFNKIILIFFLSLSIFSCTAFDKSGTINSNEDLGYSENPNMYADIEPSRIVSAKSIDSDQLFVDGSKDIPLAANLTKVSEDGLDFDSASGSVIAITYKSSENLLTVKNFYLKTLPQLGWKNLTNNQPNVDLLRFKRDNEKLEIEFLNFNGDFLIKFFVESGSKN